VVLGEPAGTLSFPIGAESTTVKRHKEWEQGYRAAVVAGVRAIAQDVVAVLFATCDLAPESAKALGRLVRRFHRGELGLYACHDGEQVHLPVLVDRRYRNDLLAMPEDAHLLDLVTSNPDDVEYVDILTPTPSP
jgi:CTP:molybdopterin cytidylyltransferase MocA